MRYFSPGSGLQCSNLEDDEAPCHVYTTLPHTTDSTFFVNFHLRPKSCGNKHCQPAVLYMPTTTDFSESVDSELSRNLDFDNSKMAVAQRQAFHAFEARGHREVYTALLRDLTPNTSYSFQIIYLETGYKTKVYSARTLGDGGVQVGLLGSLHGKHVSQSLYSHLG